MKLNRPCKIILAVLLAAQTYAAVAQTTNAVAPGDYPKFIAQRNIFDPNRVPNVPWTPRARQAYTAPVVRQVDSFTLVGIIGYGEGRMAGVYAFFDGTNPDYRKTVQVDDTIANFKITDIEADSVTLMSDTNDIAVLRIGEQLHNDGVGHWLSANGTAARYNNNNGRYGRNGYGNRRRNYGNRNNGNYGSGNYNNGNYNRRGNYGNAASPASGGSQLDNQNSQASGTAPDNTASPADNAPPDNMPPPPDDNAPPDANQQNN